MRHVLKFDGLVYSRSSKKPGHGPPGETELLELNPGRRELILEKTGWDKLQPGTLNVHVENRHVRALEDIKPVFDEPPIKYPEQYANIPVKRGGYRYYKCRLKAANGKKVRGLVRCAKKPLKGTLEIVAQDCLRDVLSLSDGNQVNIRISGRLNGQQHDYAYFCDADGKSVALDGLFQDAHVFLVCSGPSFRKIDRGPLRFVYTMALNNGVKGCMPKFRPNLWLCVDGADKFLHTIWQDPHILKLAPNTHVKKWLCNNDAKAPAGLRVRDCPNVVFWERISGFNPRRFLTERGASWGNNKSQKDKNGVKGKRSCMLCAVKLLYVLGFRHIYLLGADFAMDNNAVNYSFVQARKPSSVKGNNATYRQLQWRFEQLRPYFEQSGLHVYNCNPESNLTAFDFISYEDALDKALAHTGNWRQYIKGRLENTNRLYETKWYVCPECSAHMRLSKEDCKAGANCACGRVITEDDRKKYTKDPAQRNIDSMAE